MAVLHLPAYSPLPNRTLPFAIVKFACINPTGSAQRISNNFLTSLRDDLMAGKSYLYIFSLRVCLIPMAVNSNHPLESDTFRISPGSPLNFHGP